MQELNPKLFDNNVLKASVKYKLQEIADAFLDYLKDEGLTLAIADIQFLGSNAGFDYHDNSDIDLHIVADFEAVTCDTALLQVALNAEKTRFNQDYDITIKGIPVELYVEDVKAGTNSNGIYSIKFDRWIQFPKPEPNITIDEYDENLAEWRAIATKALVYTDIDMVQNVINRLYLMRKNGLATAGRYSKGNLIFKAIRNEGLLQQLKDKRIELQSKQLTLEALLRGGRTNGQ